MLRLGTSEMLRRLLADLKSSDHQTRLRAARELDWGRPLFGLGELRAGLRTLLKNPNPAVRAEAAKTLAACDPMEAAPALAKLLADDSNLVRHRVLSLLQGLKDVRVSQAVAGRLAKESAFASGVLKAIGPDAEKAVLTHLKDKDPETTFWVLMILQEIGTATSLPALEAWPSNDSHKFQAAQAAQAIRGRLPLAADEWLRVLDDLKSSDRNRSSRAIRRIAVTEPVKDHRQEVLKCLKSLWDKRPFDRLAATKVLVRWGGKESVPLLVEGLQKWPVQRDQLIEVLAEVKTEATAAAVVQLLPRADLHKVARILLSLGPVAEKSVLGLLRDKDVRLAGLACWVLAEIGGKGSIAPLEQTSRDSNPFLAMAATQALTAIEVRLQGITKKK